MGENAVYSIVFPNSLGLKVKLKGFGGVKAGFAMIFRIQ